VIAVGGLLLFGILAAIVAGFWAAGTIGQGAYIDQADADYAKWNALKWLPLIIGIGIFVVIIALVLRKRSTGR